MMIMHNLMLMLILHNQYHTWIKIFRCSTSIDEYPCKWVVEHLPQWHDTYGKLHIIYHILFFTKFPIMRRTWPSHILCYRFHSINNLISALAPLEQPMSWTTCQSMPQRCTWVFIYHIPRASIKTFCLIPLALQKPQGISVYKLIQ